MSDKGNSRTVYSTGTGGTCQKCGWPQRDCKCSSQFAKEEAVPAKLVAKLRMEKTGRGGKTATVIYDLPRNDAFLKALCQELKRSCGTGGTVHEDTIEIQGDLRGRIRDLLVKKGYTVKG